MNDTFDALCDAAEEKRRRHSANGSAGPRSWRDHVTTAAQLQRQTFPPVSYVVPQLIPEGLSIIAGRPKVGKSWLALDVCIAVAAGRLLPGRTQAGTGRRSVLRPGGQPAPATAAHRQAAVAIQHVMAGTADARNVMAAARSRWR